MKETLEGIDGIGALHVFRNGHCYNYSWYVTFASNPGRQPDMELQENNITGVDAQIDIKHFQDGYYHVDPIPGDFLNTVHTVPQVRT